MVGIIFNKGEYYNYIYERQVINDCQMQWYETNDIKCQNLKEKVRKIDDEELKNGGVKIPAKSIFDYLILLGSILQVIFIAVASYLLGVFHKKDKLKDIWKCIPVLFGIFLLCSVLNITQIFVNGVFSSNDLLRFMFEIAVSFVMIILGRKIS